MVVSDRESMHVHVLVHVSSYSVGWSERQCVCVCDRCKELQHGVE